MNEQILRDFQYEQFIKFQTKIEDEMQEDLKIPKGNNFIK